LRTRYSGGLRHSSKVPQEAGYQAGQEQVKSCRAPGAHRDALREGAKALYRALDARSNDKDDFAQMAPEDEVLLLHVME
jgi:hypothetical protein